MFEFVDSSILAAAGIAALASCLFTALARPVAGRLGLVDRPGGWRKMHGWAVPLLGGPAILVALLLTWGVTASWAADLSITVPPGRANSGPPPMAALFLSAGLFCLVGLWDDKWPLRARPKLLLQIAASIPYAFWGRSIDVVQILGYQLDLGAFGALGTIVWVVGCANIINLADGLDGLATTIGLIICVAVAVLSGMQGMAELVLFAAVCSGVLFGFLVHNWPPARIFLGDSGSLLIGFLVGAMSIESSLKQATGFALAVPLVLVSIPVFDTLMAIARRRLTGRSIGDGDRGHIHHCLQDRGLSSLQALLAISALCALMAAASLMAAATRTEVVALGLCVVLLLLLVAGRLFGHYETALAYRHLRNWTALPGDLWNLLRLRQYLAGAGVARPLRAAECWTEATRCVRRLGGWRLEVECRDRRTMEPLWRLDWQRSESPATQTGVPSWQVTYSVPGPGGRHAIVTAYGRSRRKLDERRLTGLSRLLDLFCTACIGDNAQRLPAAEHEAAAPVFALGPRDFDAIRTLPVTATASADGSRKVA